MRNAHLTALPLVIILSACGGSGTTVEEFGPNGLPYGAVGLVANKSQLEKLAGTRFTADGVLGSYDTNVFDASVKTVKSTITLVDDDTLRIKLDGTTYTLNSADGGVTFVGGQVSAIPVYSSSSSAGTQSALFYRVLDEDNSDDAVFSAHLISGFETDPDELPSGTVTYTGGAGMEIFDSAGNQVTIFDDPGNLLRPGDLGDNGQLTLTVNLGNKDVVGEITADATFEGTDDPLALTLTGTLSGTGISGVLTEKAGTDNTGLAFTDGKFAGQLFGAGARDVGGTISAEVSGADIADGTNAAVGFFVGAR